MNMIQFSNGLVEAGNVRNVVKPLPSFNPVPEQLPGAETKEVQSGPSETTETPLNAADLLPKEPIVPLAPPVAETPAPEATEAKA